MVKLFFSAGCIIAFAGCTQVQQVCPKIETLEIVPKIEINVADTCVCGSDLNLLINHDRQLRKSETYYIDAVTTYNKDFVDK